MYFTWVENRTSRERLSIQQFHEWLKQNKHEKHLFGKLCEDFIVYNKILSKTYFDLEVCKYAISENLNSDK